MKHIVSATIGGRNLTLETGELARQASGSVVVSYDDTVVLCAAVAEMNPRVGMSFFPLTIEYREKTYAAGLFPGGFIKREGRLSDRETVGCRMVDRSMRPLFPETFSCETQVQAIVVSSDQQNQADILAISGCSAAVAVSDIPHHGPVAGVRIGRVDGELLVNPTIAELEVSTMNLVVAGTADAINMVEGGAQEEPEEVFIDALMLAHEEIKKIVAMQVELQRRGGKPKRIVEEKVIDAEFDKRIRMLVTEKVKQALVDPSKHVRQEQLDAILDEARDAMIEDLDDASLRTLKDVFHDIEREELRALAVEKGQRADGRSSTDIREITTRVRVFPRPHGSALFTRGETQALATVTLGTSQDEQRVDDLTGKSSKRFTLHYNFPSFSVGEVKPIRGPGRREIGHGALAERALLPVLPVADDFPYTIRVVSEILESNGSSSMASVCGGSLALMDAGVPISKPVAGIAMGLIKEDDDKLSILSDILGVEDHLGDMDFKVAGTRDGITAIQMDIKVHGIGRDVLERALEQARQGRMHILDTMDEVLDKPREEISEHAPRIFTIQVNPDKLRDVIGPGGKMIRSITDATQSSIDIRDDGTILIATPNGELAQQAITLIRNITQEAEVGKLYQGKVKRIVDFGAFIEIFPGTDGLCHISQLAEHRVRTVSDELKEGEEVLVKCIDVDRNGRIRLSRKEAVRDQAATES